MNGYTKLFCCIIASTVWRESNETRIVWITMLALANKHGVVESSLPGLADMARVSIADCEAALVALEAPDHYSRTKEFEGRRIRPCEGGWLVLNHAKYRAKMGADERREYLRRKQQECRGRKRQHAVNITVDKSTLSTHAEADAETNADSVPPSPPAARPVVDGSEGSPASKNEHVGKSNHQQFVADWCAYYERRCKVPYPMTPRDAKAVKQLLQHFGGPDQAKAFIKSCHARSQEGYPFGGTETLYDLANGLARLEAALSKPANGTHSKSHRTGHDRNAGTLNDPSDYAD